MAEITSLKVTLTRETEESPLKIPWVLLGLLPGPLTFGLVTFYLLEYFSTSLVTSMICATVAAVVINFIVLKFPYVFMVYAISLPELVGRILRIYIVQLAVSYSPLPQIQENMKVFLGAYTCTYDIALQASKGAANDVIRGASIIAERLISSLNEVSEKIQAIFTNVIDTLFVPLDQMKLWLDQVDNFNTKCSSSIDNAYSSCNSRVPGLKEVCRNTAGIFTSSACSGLENNMSPCEVFNENRINICSTFSYISEPKKYLSDLKGLLDESKSHFEFQVSLNTDFRNNVTTDSIQNIRTELEQLIEDFEPLKAVDQFFSYLIIFTLLHILISKSLLVWKYQHGKSVKCKKVSKLFLATNPMTIQLGLLFILGLVDVGIRKIFALHKEMFDRHSISVSSEYDAKVENIGGEIGQLLADAISRSFSVGDKMRHSVSLGECYTENMNPPSYSSYAFVAVGCLLGIVTYAIDISFRLHQENVIKTTEKLYRQIRKRSGSFLK